MKKKDRKKRKKDRKKKKKNIKGKIVHLNRRMVGSEKHRAQYLFSLIEAMEILSCCFQLLWLRRLFKKWFLFNEVEEFSADEIDDDSDGDEEEQEDGNGDGDDSPPQYSNIETTCFPGSITTSLPSLDDKKSSLWSYQVTPSIVQSCTCITEELRISVVTWNLAGRIPSSNLELKDCVDMNPPADIYVFGFQEIVPLNASNVFGVEDTEPAILWKAMIREALNEKSANSCLDSPSSLSQEKTQSTSKDGCNGEIIHRDGISNSLHEDRGKSEWVSGSSVAEAEALVTPLLPSMSRSPSNMNMKHKHCYVCVASKQMVGIHISVWIHRRLKRHIHNLSVSSVGLGLMGCLGNKGSISVSMLLHKTTFCFICTHLTSGHKEGDENRRNWDATEVIKRTWFPPAKVASVEAPQTIWDHERIIWLGDLNYRVDLMDDKIRFLIAQKDWATLLKEDQLTKQLLGGNVFDGWHEGTMSFSPTYKYEFDSTEYIRGKQRSPAWCDRILWYGKGLKQQLYKRGESTFSDHRPVIAIFLAEVEMLLVHLDGH